MVDDEKRVWKPADASELYQIAHWGGGYFSIGENGHVRVHPEKDVDRSIDIKQLVDSLQMRGLGLPLLLRFNGILKNRIMEIREAFQQAISDSDYQGQYVAVYPIKVNQQRHVVEEFLQHGSPLGFGLEAGSKPELLAVVAMTNNETPVICNGFKDFEFIQMAMLAQKIGRRVIPVIERFRELELILQYAEKIGVRPTLGMRVKLAARGSGRWQASGGYRSKFGLTVGELLAALDLLKQHGMEDCFKLLHFHLGSQISGIHFMKSAFTEAARVYVDLHRRGAGLEFLDVGGGLGVDYDGSQTNFRVQRELHVTGIRERRRASHPDGV